MSKENLAWAKVLATVLKMPGVKVDRISFLRRELRPYCNQSRLQMIGSVRPYTVVSDEVVDKLARQCVRTHTALATATSTVAGLPGGLAMAATLPADLVQYFYHVFVLSQKLAYLYGYPDLCEEDGHLSDMACDLLTIFMGVMMGAPVAEKGIDELAKAIAGNAVTRLPRVALTKTALVPIAAQVARFVGTRYSKAGLAKGVGRLIPLAGGLFSGSLTLLTFSRGASRLRRQLSAQRRLFDDGAIDTIEMAGIKASFVKAAQAERDPLRVELAVIEALINMAKINDEVTPAKYKVIEQRIARSKADARQKLDLLGNIDSDRSYDVDFDLIAADREAARELMDALNALAAMDEKTTMAEKIYLNMVARKLGLTAAGTNQQT